MFTGIVEATGMVISRVLQKENIDFQIQSPISGSLKVDQSVSHDGVCLTVTKIEDNSHWVTAIQETLIKSNLSQWSPGTEVNLERALKLGGRLDGHLVQGHVDCVAQCIALEEVGGSHLISFNFPESMSHLLIPKGSIAVNGISLTIAELRDRRFSVAIIPYTFENTSIRQLRVGMTVNLEFDMVGKYVHRHFLLESA